MQVAETFCLDADHDHDDQKDENGLANKNEEMLFHRYARLDTCVTVIDAYEFPNIVNSTQRFAEKFPEEIQDSANSSTETSAELAIANAKAIANPNAEGEKHISQLLIEQVEFANVVIVNKVDLLKNEQEEKNLRELIKTLNPAARIIMTSYSKVDLDDILNTKSFNMEEASHAAGWLQSLSNHQALASERDEYDIFSFIYRARRPFHPCRLHQWLKTMFYVHDPLLTEDSHPKSMIFFPFVSCIFYAL